MQTINTDELTIYQWHGSERVIARDDDAGRALASRVLCGERADADAADATGFACPDLTDEQADHLRRHGWAQCD